MRLVFAFTMSTSRNNNNGNISADTADKSTDTGPTSVWPVIQLPSHPKIHYASNSDNTKMVQAVDSTMNYCHDSVRQMHTRRDLGGTDSGLEGASWVSPRVQIHNARLRAHKPTLDQQGFELLHYPPPTSSTNVDFTNKEAVVEHYYPHCEELLKAHTGAAMVVAFDHNVRVSGSKLHDQQGNTVLQQPIGVVHNDYTVVSAPRRLEQLGQPPKANDAFVSKLQSEQSSGDNPQEDNSQPVIISKSLLDPGLVQEVLEGKRRFVFCNVWRSMDTTSSIQQFPLACVDATTQSLEELLTFQIIYADRIGENYFSRVPPAEGQKNQHQWNYFPHMVHDEALLIKQWDSEGSLAQPPNAKPSNGDFKSTFSLHSAFQDPTSPEDAPPRQSIEVRCVLIFDKQE